MREPVSRRANGLGLPSAPISIGPGSKTRGRGPPTYRGLSRPLFYRSFKRTSSETKAHAGFTTSRPPPGREDAPQGRDEEIGDVAAYVIDQANGDKWDD